MPFIFLMFLVSSSFAMTNLPDRYANLTNTTTGLTSTIQLVSAISRHVYVISFAGNGSSTSSTNFTDALTCTNSTQLVRGCGNTSIAYDAKNITINETSSLTVKYNMTLNISNISLINTSTFDIAIYGGHFRQFATNITNVTACTNSTISSGTCASLARIGAGNFSILENASNNTPYNSTLSMANISLNITTGALNMSDCSLSIHIYGAYFGTTGPVTVDVLYNNTTWTTFRNLNTNSYDWANVTGLDPITYAFQNITYVRLNHAANGNNSTDLNNTIDIDYFGMVRTCNNTVSGNVVVQVWNGTEFVNKTNLTTDAMGWSNITGLSGAAYIFDNGTLNATNVSFFHPSAGANGSTGAVIDYFGVITQNTSTVTQIATVGIEGSIDNTNWFRFDTDSDVTASSYTLITNMTVPFVRFNITALTIGTDASNYLTIRYLGVY